MKLFISIIVGVCFWGCVHSGQPVGDHKARVSLKKPVKHKVVNIEVKKIDTAIKKLTPSVSDEWSNQLSNKIFAVSVDQNIDWKILVAVMKQESNFDPKARNNKGIGLGQIEPLWSRHYGYKHQALWDWRFNVDVMGKILAHYRDIQKKNDPLYWASAYHSMTPKYRSRYLHKIKRHYEVATTVASN